MRPVKIGRPREVENPVRVCVRIASADYDRLDREARAQGTSVPAIIRARVSVLETPSPDRSVHNRS